MLLNCNFVSMYLWIVKKILSLLNKIIMVYLTTDIFVIFTKCSICWNWSPLLFWYILRKITLKIIAASQMASHPRSPTETIASSLNKWRQRRKTERGLTDCQTPFTLPGRASWQTSISRDSHLCWGFTSEGWGVTRASYHPIWLSVLHLRLPSGQSKARSCLATELISSHQSKASSSNGLCLSVSTDTQSLPFCLRLWRSSSLEAWLDIFLAGTCLSSVFLFLTFWILSEYTFTSLHHKHLGLFMHNLLILSHLYNHSGINDNS